MFKKLLTSVLALCLLMGTIFTAFPVAVAATETATETEVGGSVEAEDESESGDDTTGGNGDESGWFAKNAAWVIPVGIVGLGGIGVGIYFLLVKKKYVDLVEAMKKLFDRSKTDKNSKKDEDEETRDSE